MSNLKYQSLAQLEASKIACEARISKLKSDLSGQETRLVWIDSYIFKNTVQELTMSEIEHALGFKVIIK